MTGFASASDALVGPGYNNTINFRLSGFRATTNTVIQVDSELDVIGEALSFEDDSNLSKREMLPLFDITYRFNPRHMLDFTFVDLSRSGSTYFGREGVTTDDILWATGSAIESQFDREVYRLSYGYSFLMDGKRELGLLLGLHITRFNTEHFPITGNEIVVEGDARRTYDSGFSIPLPVFGLHGTYAFRSDLYLRGWGQIFALEYDDYDGRLYNLAGMLEYALDEPYGIGLGYAYYGYDLDADRDSLNRSFEYNFRGPTLFFSATF
jgi:hypothetical protein